MIHVESENCSVFELQRMLENTLSNYFPSPEEESGMKRGQ